MRFKTHYKGYTIWNNETSNGDEFIVMDNENKHYCDTYSKAQELIESLIDKDKNKGIEMKDRKEYYMTTLVYDPILGAKMVEIPMYWTKIQQQKQFSKTR